MLEVTGMRKPKRINSFRKYRLSLGLSRENVASETGISFSYLEKIENDVRIPGRETLMKLSKFYNCKVEDLLETA
jgi:transcriptional regulator with XRE-family HTH domain